MIDEIDKVPVAKTANGSLSLLFRKFIKSAKLTKALPYLMTRYVETRIAQKRLSSSENTKSVSKATLQDNIYGSEMTWKTFIELFIGFLGAVKLELTIKAHLPAVLKIAPVIVSITIDGNDENMDSLLQEPYDLPEEDIKKIIAEGKAKHGTK